MDKKIITQAKFEVSTRTIRSVPENYWLASMDSWDGAVDHDAMALIFAAAPQMLAALEFALPIMEHLRGGEHGVYECDLMKMRAALALAKGEIVLARGESAPC